MFFHSLLPSRRGRVYGLAGVAASSEAELVAFNPVTAPSASAQLDLLSPAAAAPSIPVEAEHQFNIPSALPLTRGANQEELMETLVTGGAGTAVSAEVELDATNPFVIPSTSVRLEAPIPAATHSIAGASWLQERAKPKEPMTAALGYFTPC